MSSQSSELRADRFLWYVRLVQLVFVLVVLGVAGQSSSTWVSDTSCSVPSDFAWNIACAVLTLLLLLYLVPTTGPLSRTSFWNPWAQLALDAVFLIFWIAAAAISSPDCSRLCNACAGQFGSGGYGSVYWDDLSCSCGDTSYDKRSLNLLFGRSSLSSAAKVAGKATSTSIKQGFDAAVVVLFFVTFAYSTYTVVKARRAAPNFQQEEPAEHVDDKTPGATVNEVPPQGTEV